MERKLKQAQGNWVDGDRFWGREGDIRLLTRKIDEGAHISLVAQRRMGKTSLKKELQRRLSDRYICLFIDLQKDSEPADAVVAQPLNKALRISLEAGKRFVFECVECGIRRN